MFLGNRKTIQYGGSVLQILLSLALVVGALSWGATYIKSQTSPIVSPLPDTPQPRRSTIIFFFAPKKNPEELEKKIAEIVGSSWKNYSILVKEYGSDFIVDLNDTVIYTAASVNKIPILAGLYYLAQTGEIDLDKTITLQAQDIQDYGTGSIRYDPPGTVYSLKTLAKLMMQKSDNTAAYILSNHTIGIEALQKLVDSWGLVQTDIANNKTSNKDIEKLMEKIFTGKIANQALTQEMLAFMKDSDFEDRLPALLPKDVTVYHKIGTEVGILHDVGIVKTPQKTYYIGILVSDVSDEAASTQTMARISKTVFDFLK